MWFLSHHCVLEEAGRGTGNFFLVSGLQVTSSRPDWGAGCRTAGYLGLLDSKGGV